MNSEISPCLWFDGNAKEAAMFYCDVFHHAEILSSDEIVTHFSINRRKYTALNGGPQFQLNGSVSLYIYCGSDIEIERLYDLLKKDGTVDMPLAAYGWCRKYARSYR